MTSLRYCELKACMYAICYVHVHVHVRTVHLYYACTCMSHACRSKCVCGGTESRHSLNTYCREQECVAQTSTTDTDCWEFLVVKDLLFIFQPPIAPNHHKHRVVPKQPASIHAHKCLDILSKASFGCWTEGGND